MRTAAVAVFLLAAVGIQASPQRVTSYQGVRLGAVTFPGVGESKNTERTEQKCVTPEELESCERHCRIMKEEFRGGRCIEGTCHCEPLEGSRNSGGEDGHVTVECERVVPVGSVAESERHKACKTHCQLLKKDYTDGQCVEGKCHCREKSMEVEPAVEEVVRKEVVVTEEQHTEMKFEERGKCNSHCHESGKDGRWIEGDCQCVEKVKCGDEKNREHCATHCRELGHEEGTCHEGVCECGPITHLPTERVTERRMPTAARCEDLAPKGDRAAHDAACLSHCREMKENFQRGVCMEGVCHCTA